MTRVAMFMHGGLAPEWSREGVPAIGALVRRLAELFDLTVYTLMRPDGDREPFSCGNAAVRVVRSGEDDHIVKTAPRLLRAFWQDHRREPFGLVHGFWALPGGLTSVLAGRAARIPSIVTMLGGEAACFPEIGYGNMNKRGPRAATLLTCNHADALTALTRYQLDQLRRFGGRKFRRTHVIPFGADSSLFPFSEWRPDPPPYCLLHVGHLNPVKDQATLLRAFLLISRRVACQLTIIGEDTMDGSLQRLAGELGISPRVTFEGFVPHEELHRHFASAHLLVHSSLYEGEGVVFAEAASSGLPICGTRVGLLADMGEALGVTVEPGDPAALAEAVLGLLCDSTRIQKLQEQGRVWAREHSSDWTAGRFAELYRNLLPALPGDGVQGEQGWAAVPASSDESGPRKLPSTEFVCPSCHGTLEQITGGWRCPAEDFRFGMEEGIPTFILPHRRSALEGFLTTYRRVRAREGWASSSPEYYRDLPYDDRSGQHASVWRIRARTFDCFLGHLARHGSLLSGCVLDAGAGNCWLSARLAERGFDVAALDINPDPQDGLGVLAGMSPALRSKIFPVRAEFDALPFGSESFDLALLNASLHYSSDIMHTLEGLLKVLKRGGRLYVLDSPAYRSIEAGEQMVRERNERFSEQFGIATAEERATGFITMDIIRQVQERHRVELLDPGYGIRWALRPHIARLLRRREPALFLIIVVHKD